LTICCRLGNCRGRRWLGQEFFLKFVRRHGPSEEIALTFLATHANEVVCGCAVFDSFGDYRQIQLFAKPDGGAHDCGVIGIGQQSEHERAVDLQAVQREFFQVAQAGITRAEVIKYDPDAKRLNLQERVQRKPFRRATRCPR
jgi:hypothetical protein